MAAGLKSVEAGDPYEAVAICFPQEAGAAPDERMARCFVEEFAMIGFPAERILRLFQLRTYAGAHAILERQGEPFIRAIIEDVFRAPLAPAGPRLEGKDA